MGNPPKGFEILFSEKSPKKAVKGKGVTGSETGQPQSKTSTSQANPTPHQTILTSSISYKKATTVAKKVAFHESPPAVRLSSSSEPAESVPRNITPLMERLDMTDQPHGGGRSHAPSEASEESSRNQALLLRVYPAEKIRASYPSREQINRPSRQYRQGELVWCIIDPPLLGDDSGAVIDQWPGIIAANRVKKNIKSKDMIEEEELYQVILLALTDSFVLPHSGLSPYRSYTPKSSLIALLQSFPPPSISNLPKQLYHFHRHLSYHSTQHRDEIVNVPKDPFLEAWGPYSLALQTAARLAMTWGFAYPHESKPGGQELDDVPRFSGLWWGSELLLIDEMAMLICDREQLARHTSLRHLISTEDGDNERAILLQIRRIEAQPSEYGPVGGRGVLVGMLYELVPVLSNISLDSAQSMPKQPAPFGTMWKRVLPLEYEVQVDVEYLEGRYYDSLSGPALNSQEVDPKVILALQALAPGYMRVGSNIPVIYQNTRGEMCRFAEEKAHDDLEDYWTEKSQEQMQTE